MGEIINFLTAIRNKIGYEAFIFIGFSFITLTFGEQLSASSKVAPELEVTIRVLAGILFAVGLLIAFLRIFYSFFTLRPARGMIDGLAAGLIAGLIGGYFGYGFHSGSQYPLHPFLRTLLCIPYATSIGGILGLCIDLYHPDRKISWRKYLGALVLSFAILFAVVGFGLFLFVPAFSGAGITLSNIQLIFEVGLLAITAIVAFGFSWPIKKYLTRFLFIFFSITIARIITFLVAIENPAQSVVSLGQLQYLDTLEGGINLAISAIILMLWFIATYGCFYLDHPIATRLERFLTTSR
ncbi:MAG: hypothetical protein ACFB0E_09440 [Leptolyngbyaceae cyanobacterium]